MDVDRADVFLPLSKQTERKQRFAHKYTTHESIHVYKLNAKDIDLRVFFLRDGEEKYNFEKFRKLASEPRLKTFESISTSDPNFPRINLRVFDGPREYTWNSRLVARVNLPPFGLSQEFKLIKPSITYYRRQIDKFLWIFTNSARERSETKSPPISLRINKIIRLFSFFFLFLSFSPTLSLRFRIYVIPFPGKERRDPNYLSLWTRRTFHGRCTPETRSSSPNSCRKVIPGQ